MSKKSAERKISVAIELGETTFGFSLTFKDAVGHVACVTFEAEKEPARSPQTENLRTQLSKLGGTPLEAESVDIVVSDNWFIPSSVLAEWRRTLVERFLRALRITYKQEWHVWENTSHAYEIPNLTYQGNVMNNQAAFFYKTHGVQSIAPAFEQSMPSGEKEVMLCKHCIRYSLGGCMVHQGKRLPYREPYYLVAGDGRRFRLEFDCKNCRMSVLYT